MMLPRPSRSFRQLSSSPRTWPWPITSSDWRFARRARRKRRDSSSKRPANWIPTSNLRVNRQILDAGVLAVSRVLTYTLLTPRNAQAVKTPFARILHCLIHTFGYNPFPSGQGGNPTRHLPGFDFIAPDRRRELRKWTRPRNLRRIPTV